MLNTIIEQKAEFINTLFKDLDGTIEYRFIPKKGTDGNIKKAWFDCTEKAIQYDLPGFNYNSYVGIFTRKDQSFGGADNCLTSKVIWADLDNVTYRQAMNRLEKTRLPYPTMVVNSGHGIHFYWVLKQRQGQQVKAINEKVAILLGSDPKVTDISRVMRIPGSVNINGDIPVRCELIESHENNIYSIDKLAELLRVELPKGNGSNDFSDTFADTDTEGKGYGNLDYVIDIDRVDKPCIRSMFKGVHEGQRNTALGRLTKYLKVAGYTKKKAKGIIRVWNKNNNPPEDTEKLNNDFNSYWHGDYKLLGCKNENEKLQQQLSAHCKPEQCGHHKTIGNTTIGEGVELNNRMFNQYEKFTGNDLIVFGVLKSYEQGLNIDTLKFKLTPRKKNKPCMSENTMRKALSNLRKAGLISKLNGSKKKGIKDFYKVINQGTYGMGYTFLNVGAIHGAIDGRVTPPEFKTYVLLWKYNFNNKGKVNPSLKTVGQEMGVSQSAVSKYLKKLELHGYIERHYKYTDKGNEKLYCELKV